MKELNLLPARTALVAIDLQNLIVSRQTQPHDARTVVENTAQLASALRVKGGFIVWVRVAFSADGKDCLQSVCDQSWTPPRELPPDASEFAPGLSIQPTDHIVTKRQWGAFYGTDLDLQLRRRGMTTIVLAGIATNIGVESTARDAFERGYEQIFAEDAMSALAAAHHEHAVTQILPRIGRVRRTAEVLAAL
ncbi:MAG TPA: hydrolase [Candidatus Paceibacterota bacterium]|nr:hydrolase [Candidatus Paceibacterota bacterium]